MPNKIGRMDFIKEVGLAFAFCALNPFFGSVLAKGKSHKLWGFNYGNWTTGDYPFATAWKRQDYIDSQGIVKVDITKGKRYRSKGSLETTLEIAGVSNTHRQGEFFVDLRYPPNYEGTSPYIVKESAPGKPLGVDLSGKTLAALVLCQKGLSGLRNAPSGLQLFAKSMNVVNGKEIWSSYYGLWNNVYNAANIGSAPSYYGDVLEGKWSLIHMRLPDPKNPGSRPGYAYMDWTFDPTSIALIGVKYGLNKNCSEDISGKIWFDNIGWMGLEWDVPMDYMDVKLWDKLRKKTTPLNVNLGGSKCTVSAKEKVLFTFEDVVDPITSMKKNGFNSATVLQTEYMPSPTATTIAPVDRKTHSLDEIAKTIDCMVAQGLTVGVKPHVDVVDDSWRGYIQPTDKAAWFAAYTDFIVKYATVAQEHGASIFVMGTEFKSLNSDNRAEWENVFRRVREVFKGKLTYASNWDDYENICFWDLVDFIGIDAYMPLSDSQTPSKEELVAAWSPWIQKLEEFQAKTGKEIMFTEVGYRSTDYPARVPSEYLEQRPANQEAQLNCYKAVIESFKDKPWFMGAWFWNRLPIKDAGGKYNTDFNSEDKMGDLCLKKK
jgi:hypothetical protein